MISPKLLELIRCPIDGQSLLPANAAMVSAINNLIQRRELRDDADGLIEAPLDGALVTIDGTRAYAIRGGIPTLIPGEAIALPVSVQSLLKPIDESF